MIHIQKILKPVILYFTILCLSLLILSCTAAEQNTAAPVFTDPLSKAASYIPEVSCLPGWVLKGEVLKISTDEFQDHLKTDHLKYISADCIGTCLAEYQPEINSDNTVKVRIFVFDHFEQATALYKSDLETGKRSVRLGDEGNLNRYEYRFRNNRYYIKVSVDTIEAQFQEAMKKLAYCLNDNLIGGTRNE